jgi:arsenate reductase (thioredoxin)
VRRRRVLFLCSGNSARSQMAEGLANALRGDAWQAASAGTDPAGYVHPLAVKAMEEVGIDISAQRSKGTAEFGNTDLDLVVTVCDRAKEMCPVWLGRGKRQHHSFDDPAEANGSEEEQLDVFRRVRDEIRAMVMAL